MGSAMCLPAQIDCSSLAYPLCRRYAWEGRPSPKKRKSKGAAFRVSCETTVPPAGLGTPLPCSVPLTLLSCANQPSHAHCRRRSGLSTLVLTIEMRVLVAPFVVVVLLAPGSNLEEPPYSPSRALGYPQTSSRFGLATPHILTRSHPPKRFRALLPVP